MTLRVEDDRLPWGTVERVLDETMPTRAELDAVRVAWCRDRAREHATLGSTAGARSFAPKLELSLHVGQSDVGAAGERSKRT